MTSRERILAALSGSVADRPPVCNPTSVATVALMDVAHAPFPDAHRDPESMARLAATGFTELGFDSVMPVFSVVQECSALGCRIDWGRKDMFPFVNTRDPLWREPEEIRIPDSFLEHPDTLCVLQAIRILRKELGPDVAIFGKAMGPCTLAYHCFGLENFLLLSVDDPAKACACLDRFKAATLRFALAQIDAGADVVTIPDHATGDLVSARFYRHFLRDIHAELARSLPVPIILHICGRTLDRMPDIAGTGVAGFHFDSRNDPRAGMEAVGGRMALVGSVNNPVTLLTKGPAEVRQEVFQDLDAGIPLIAPECAIPLDTPVGNLQAIVSAVLEWCGRRGPKIMR
jgi:[methyl-Co(III) methanol-specific corrinoid protein]:coenzyme M methyltransferase